MKTNPRQDKKLLLNIAREVFGELSNRTEGTSFRLRWPSRVGEVNTGGWRAKIGDLGKGQPRLQIWLDRFAGHKTRKFNFCFYWADRTKMRRLANRAAKQLPIHRRITEKDTERDGYSFLSEPLRRDEFGPVILEEYRGKWCYYGIYLSVGKNPKLCVRTAAAFFETVARTRPNVPQESETNEIYPQFENRKLVVSHIQRERSRFLADGCKRRDDYRCQVCGIRFKEIYGSKLGDGFAEAHHRIPLNKLKARIKTQVEDLATVCANCHRMLHRMDDKYDDVEKLKRIFYQQKR